MQLDSCGVADANQGSSHLACVHAVKVLALVDCGMVRVGCDRLPELQKLPVEQWQLRQPRMT